MTCKYSSLPNVPLIIYELFTLDSIDINRLSNCVPLISYENITDGQLEYTQAFNNKARAKLVLPIDDAPPIITKSDSCQPPVNLSILSDQTFSLSENINFLNAWIGTLSFTFQIYFDFSGYIDMETGIALLFNINLPINFNSPYKATGIIDFWQRWHITLTNFLTAYIYTPLLKSFKNLDFFCDIINPFAMQGLGSKIIEDTKS